MAADPLASIGKGIVQVNLRLNRILELLEHAPATAGTPTAASGGETGEILFELLDALERALERPPPRRWWSRLLGRPAPDDGLHRGLDLARGRALARLRHLGVEVIDATGSFDAELHEAIERLPAPPGVADGSIARVHRTGFVARDGVGRRVVRAAQVSVYSQRSEQR